jgi:hypothetical protein
MRYDIAKAFLEYFTTRIRNDRERIDEKLQSRGNIIVARWKKSAAKRTNFLKFAEGQFHFPKWSGFSKDKPATWSQIQEERTRDFALLPYLTVEQFVADPMKLLRLLFLRTQYGPEVWVPFDMHRLLEPGNLD